MNYQRRAGNSERRRNNFTQRVVLHCRFRPNEQQRKFEANPGLECFHSDTISMASTAKKSFIKSDLFRRRDNATETHIHTLCQRSFEKTKCLRLYLTGLLPDAS